MQDLRASAPFPGALPFLSPAKINLFFHVLHRREDGFHEICSEYQAISLCDTLWVALASEDCFTCTDPTLELDHTNLVQKALTLFRQKTGSTASFRIHLEKKIPREAGLGGGSSNAATALWAFCTLTGLSTAMLKEWGATIGSDVPFFFSLGRAHVTGRGEKVLDLPPQDPLSFLIVKPNWGLSTPKVYQAMAPFLALPSKVRESFYANDLEDPAFFLSPTLAQVKATLFQKGMQTVTLSGSGTAFFCTGDLAKKEEIVATFPHFQLFFVTSIYRRGQSWYEL